MDVAYKIFVRYNLRQMLWKSWEIDYEIEIRVFWCSSGNDYGGYVRFFAIVLGINCLMLGPEYYMKGIIALIVAVLIGVTRYVNEHPETDINVITPQRGYMQGFLEFCDKKIAGVCKEI